MLSWRLLLACAPAGAPRSSLNAATNAATGLSKVTGVGRGRISEYLNKKRPLNLKMIRRLSEKLRIPPAVLIAEYALQKPRGLRDQSKD